MTVTLEQVDQLLTHWKKTIALVSQNLIDLQEIPAYQRLTGDSGYPKVQLTGVTAAQVTPALEAMNRLFQHFDLLLHTLNTATSLRQQIPRFRGSEQKVQEIEQLFTGASIQLPAIQIPLAQRGLLSAAEIPSAISPNDLLAAMTEAFQVAKEAVVAVEHAWSSLEIQLAQVKAEILSLQQQATLLGQATIGELITAQQIASALHDRIEQDPLGVTADFDREVQPLLHQVRKNLEQFSQQRTQIQEKFRRGHESLNQLIDLNQRAIAAFTESQQKVVDHSALQPPLPPEQIDALTQWLIRLETKFAEGLVNPVQIGLDNWIAKTQAYLVAEQAAWTANRSPLELRQELRGRLDALKAKAVAWGLAENQTLTELAQQAKQLLYTRPTPLDQAVDLVTRYERELNRK